MIAHSLGSVFGFLAITIGPDPIVEMTVEDANCLVRVGWTVLAEECQPGTLTLLRYSGRPSKPARRRNRGDRPFVSPLGVISVTAARGNRRERCPQSAPMAWTRSSISVKRVDSIAS